MATRFLANEHETLDVGAQFASLLKPGWVIFLHGDLGAGKTTLVRGLLRGLGFAGRVKSPTYTLVESYNASSLYLYHFDLYRFKHEQEWLEAGFDEIFNGTNICLVEWPERAAKLLPNADIHIHLDMEGDGRRVTIATENTDVARALADCFGPQT